MKEKVLIIVAHPDDEVLGCGGYISKYRNSKEFKVIFIGEGTSCRYSKYKLNNEVEDKILKRQKQSIRSLKFLGVEKFQHYNLPCGRFDSIDIIDINKIIEKEISKFKPNIILTHSLNDCNNDHRIINRSVMMATRPSKFNMFLSEIKSFEILSSTEWNFESQFNPNFFEILSKKNINEKIKAFYYYDGEVQSEDMPRTSDGLITLAKNRGKIINSKYAEAFRLIRKTC